MPDRKIIVLDDDPTGSQTVHGCLLLTKWDKSTLQRGLDDDSPLFFVLTNTRGMDRASAEAVTREVCANLKTLLPDDGDYIFVSRSDSTLRGHYPLETDIMAEELGPFDAHFLVPAFFEGGRFTVGSVHYVRTPDGAVPAHETEFAKDSVFGYSDSYLPRYVEEKTGGRIPAEEVVLFSLKDIRNGCLSRLLELSGNVCCAVDAETQSDLDRFARDVTEAAGRGKRFLFRSAASLLTSLAALPPQPVAPENMWRYVQPDRPGLVLVGSHVKKTTLQLEVLLKEKGTVPVEVDVDRITAGGEALFAEISGNVRAAMERGATPVVFTSRSERTFADSGTRLAFGEAVSAFLMRIVSTLPETTGYLISKGGITSNDVLSTGLGLPASRVVGQILPGCTVVVTPEAHRLPEIPVVIFPGNVGDENSLAEAYRRLAGGGLSSL